MLTADLFREDMEAVHSALTGLAVEAAELDRPDRNAASATLFLAFPRGDVVFADFMLGAVRDFQATSRIGVGEDGFYWDFASFVMSNFPDAPPDAIEAARHMERMMRASSRERTFLEAQFVYAFTRFEWLFERIVRIYFEEHTPARRTLESKQTFTISDFQRLGEIGAIRNEAVAAQVSEVMRFKYPERFNWFEKNVGYPRLPVLQELMNDFRSCLDVRNRIVHGDASSRNVNDPDAFDRLTIESAERAVAVVEAAGNLLLFSLGWKVNPAGRDAWISFGIDSSFQALLYERYAVATPLLIQLNDWVRRSDPEGDSPRIVQVNLWLARLGRDRLSNEAVLDEVEKWDTSNLGDAFQLAKCAILDPNGSETRELIARCLEGEIIYLRQLQFWPLFRFVRETEWFQIEYPDDH